MGGRAAGALAVAAGMISAALARIDHEERRERSQVRNRTTRRIASSVATRSGPAGCGLVYTASPGHIGGDLVDQSATG
jgi:hypothetical protein